MSEQAFWKALLADSCVADAMAVLEDNYDYTVQSGDHMNKLLQGVCPQLEMIRVFERKVNAFMFVIAC